MFQKDNYPSLSKIINLDFLPEQLSFLEQNLNTLFSKITLKGYTRNVSPSGDVISIYTRLIISDDAFLSIPGTGLKFIINDNLNKHK